MMGHKQHRAPKLFYGGINLDSRVGPDHPLRRVAEAVDFSFVRKEVGNCYGDNGNMSVDPIVVIKLMFLLFFENVNSERQLMRQLPLRLDWLWFCQYDLDDETPNHSILSKARRRWGPEVFARFFERVLAQCIEAGLVDGSIIHIDSCLIDANASKDKLGPELRVLTQEVCQKLDDNQTPQDEESSPTDNVDDDNPLHQRVSPVDPDARLAKKYGQTTLGYKDNRVVDDRHGIITATITTAANVNDAKTLAEAIESHESNTGVEVKTTVADKAYGNGENYQYLHDRDITACISHQRYKKSQTDAFTSDKFIYDQEGDCYWCPAGHALQRKYAREAEGVVIYQIDIANCQVCPHSSKCATGEKSGRQIQRSSYAPYYEWADGCLSSSQRKGLMSRRKAKAEGSFADATNNHGYKRSRWRGLTMAGIQNLMIAAVQNRRKLLGYRRPIANTVCVTLTLGPSQKPLVSAFSPFGRRFRLLWTTMSKYLLFKRAYVELST